MGAFSFLDVFGPFVASSLLFAQRVSASSDYGYSPHGAAAGNGHVKASIGAIVDLSSRIGKEQKVAIEMAVADYYDSQRLALHIRDSHGQPVQAALAAIDLKQHVQVILGPGTWEEASLVAEIGSKAYVPILSFADASPRWATKRWPFYVQASPNQDEQMTGVAAMVQSWRWHQVTVLYEDNESAAFQVIPHLSNALREVGVKISHLLALPPFASSLLSKELERLKSELCRVFVVHLSPPLAERLFDEAMKMEMMGEGYVWITTSTATSLIHSFGANTISSMQGVVGIKSYYSETMPRYKNFHSQFSEKFSLENPEEENNEPSIFALQAYDVALTATLAMGEAGNMSGQQLLENILASDFQGLTGRIQYRNQEVTATNKFQIVNVIKERKVYRKLGFWTYKLGFSKVVDDDDDENIVVYNTSVESLEQVFWPGGQSRQVPRGWNPPITPLRIGVPTHSIFTQYLNVKVNDSNNTISSSGGLPIELFKAVVKDLPYNLSYKFTPFNGTYDELVEQIHLKNFNAVVGDVAIVAQRYQHAEFTHPFTESELVMITPVRSKTSNQALLFMKPFTKAMWILIAVITIYNGFVVWLIERNHHLELKGSMVNQVGTLLWLAFTTLFSLQGEKLHSNLSRIATVVWLFVALVITQCYTASLTSMLTVQQLEPTTADVELLKNTNANIGYCKGSFVEKYLKDVLHFPHMKLKKFTSPEEYAQALESREIAAAFMEAPLAKLFLAKYCKSFALAGPTYKVGGFGFAFSKGSPLVADMSQALLNFSESGKLRELEHNVTGSQECVNSTNSCMDNENCSRLSPSSFWVLFVMTGGTSTLALVIYAIHHRRKLIHNFMLRDDQHNPIWASVLLKWWRQLIKKRSFSRKDSNDVEAHHVSSADHLDVQSQGLEERSIP
ncbi:glutamate receptor 2.5-like [Malania oleifera]|uniref:glutamate receptor 2.5-like n=1 Tax=Malania oleifera TaxID=397392 RepID=UPI0025AE5560|nr:glutamate receptor 2.5-like [Malania oleifera]